MNKQLPYFPRISHISRVFISQAFPAKAADSIYQKYYYNFLNKSIFMPNISLKDLY